MHIVGAFQIREVEVLSVDEGMLTVEGDGGCEVRQGDEGGQSDDVSAWSHDWRWEGDGCGSRRWWWTVKTHSVGLVKE